MASDNITTCEDADMAECDGEKVVTMMDVLQEQEDFEEDANAVLGASDDKNCTYSKGYIKRQAIYACLTCCPEAKSDPKKRAGVCLACSLMCHENHELIELYTKRNFRCDCGNPKFNSHPCTFTEVKSDLNEDNYYNQNFSGLYCTCQRPYPDPESTVEDEMIQCIICEDWLHASHLESTVPANEQYSEMICKICMEKNEFLHDYSELAVNTEGVEVDIVNVNGNTDSSKLNIGDDKTEVTTTNSNLNKIETEQLTTEEKLDTSDTNRTIVTEDTLILDSTEGNENKFINKDESDKEIIKDNPMETKQSEQEPPTNLSSEDASSNITQEPCNDQSEPDNNTETEKKIDSVLNTDAVSKDVTDDTAMICDKLENSNNKENVSEESTVIEQSKEQQDSETNINKLEENNTTDEAENTKKEGDAEKMEEDRLLADPEDESQKTVLEKNNDNAIDNVTSTKDTESDPVETKDLTSEIEPTPDIAENPKTCDEVMDTNKISTEAINQNENNPNIKPTDLSDSETSIENKIQSENLSKEDEKSMESTTPKDNNKEVQSGSSEKRKHTDESSDDVKAKKPKVHSNSCIRPKEIKKVYKGATFWPSNFRQKLCTCQECLSMYNDLSVLFLTDPEDTVSAYENLGKQKTNGEPATQYEKGLQALSSLDRIQQINALTEYNRMRDKLLDFLKSFKDKKEIVKEEDIKAFFAGMKPKRESDGVYFCR